MALRHDPRLTRNRPRHPPGDPQPLALLPEGLLCMLPVGDDVGKDQDAADLALLFLRDAFGLLQSHLARKSLT
jgi:hypothetical protein